MQTFTGSDTRRSKEALSKAIIVAQQKNPDALVTRFDDLNFSLAAARDALGSVSMFGGQNIVVFDGVKDHADGKDIVSILSDLAETTNSVFLREASISKDEKERLSKIGTVEEFTPIEKKSREKGGNFALAEALARRDKKGAWVEFERARRSGAAMEELHGIVFWQMKTLFLAKTLSKEDAMRAGVKEYSYRTGYAAAKNFLGDEIEERLTLLKDMYHRAHRGDDDLEVALEKFVLSI